MIIGVKEKGSRIELILRMLVGHKRMPVVIAAPTTGADRTDLHVEVFCRAGIRVIRAECGEAMRSAIQS